MLKFADLSVDNMSGGNSIDSFMQNFPNSYIPLFMMYLGRHNLLDIVEDLGDSNKRVILRITREEIKNFFEGSEYECPFIETQAEHNKLLKELLDKKDYDFVKSSISEIPLFELLKYRDKDNIYDISMCLKGEDDQTLIRIYKILSVSEEQVQKNGKVLLFLLLWEMEWHSFTNYLYSEKESEYSTENWISAFENSLSKIQAYSREKIWMQPKELTQVILSKKMPGKMFNPFAGLASYSVKSLYDEEDFYSKVYALGNEYTGQEIDPISWAVGKLRLLAYGTDSSNYVLTDSRNWTDEFFPNIICTPPFGVKIMNEMGKMEYADHFAVRRSVHNMTYGGMTACVVPASFLTRKDTYELRKQLAQERLIDTIVALPEGLFLPYTNIKTAIIFLKNERNTTVRFVDASRYYLVEGREKKLQKEGVKMLIQHNDFPDYLYKADERRLQVLKSEFLSSFTLCRADEIIERDYTFNVRSYIRQNRNANKGYEPIYLGSIFFPVISDRDEITQIIRPDKHLEYGRLVTLDDLSSNPLLPYFDYTSLQIH